MIMAGFTIYHLHQNNVIQKSLSCILKLLLQKPNSNELFSGATEVQGLTNLE